MSTEIAENIFGENNKNNNSIYTYICVVLVLLQSILPQELIVICMGALLIVFSFKNNFLINNKLIYIFLFYLFHGTINVIIGNNRIILLLFQCVGIMVSYLFYYNFLSRDNIKNIINIYIIGINVISIIIFIQQIGYIFGIRELYDYGWLVKGQQIGVVGSFYRSVAIFIEPSIIATLFSPGIYLSLKKLFNKKTDIISYGSAVITLLGAVLSFSSLVYVSIGISLMIIILTSKKISIKIGTLFIAVILCITAYTKLDFFRERIDGVFESLRGVQSENVNISSDALVTNVRVAMNSTVDNYFLGTGLGSYQLQYDKYKEIIFFNRKDSMAYDLNREDANSLFLRILTEGGILSVFLIFYFIIKFYAKRPGFNNDISNAIIVLILLRLIRCGHYFQGETFFFVALYVLNYYKSRNTITQGDMPMYGTE